MGICPMGTPLTPSITAADRKGKPVARRGRKARGLSTDGRGGSAAGSTSNGGTNPACLSSPSSFRLRFAVALLRCALPYSRLRRARRIRGGHPAEYIVQMEPGVAPLRASRSSQALGGPVTTGDVPIINGFGAVLQDDAAEELVNTPGVHAVTPNSVTAPEPAATVQRRTTDQPPAAACAARLTTPARCRHGSAARADSTSHPLNSIAALAAAAAR